MDTLILGKSKGTKRQLVIWLLLLLIINSAFFYWGYITNSYSFMSSPIVNTIVFGPLIYFFWRNERKYNFIEGNEKYLSIRNALSVERFNISDIENTHVKSGRYISYLSFKAQGFKRWYLVGSLEANEIQKLKKYADQINR